MACCDYPNGKAGVSIAAYIMSILASILAGVVFLKTWILFLLLPGLTFGFIAMILLLCTACTRMSKCGLITAAIFAFLAVVCHIVFVVYYVKFDHYYFLTRAEIALWSTAAVLNFAVGVLALKIPVPPPEGSIKNLPSGSNMQTPATTDPTSVDLSCTMDNIGNAPNKLMPSVSAMWEDDVSRRSRILSERQSLRDKGVPQEEIDLVLPVPKEDV